MLILSVGIVNSVIFLNSLPMVLPLMLRVAIRRLRLRFVVPCLLSVSRLCRRSTTMRERLT